MCEPPAGTNDPRPERCAAGEDPDYVYIQAYLKADRHEVEGDEA